MHSKKHSWQERWQLSCVFPFVRLRLVRLGMCQRVNVRHFVLHLFSELVTEPLTFTADKILKERCSQLFSQTHTVELEVSSPLCNLSDPPVGMLHASQHL